MPKKRQTSTSVATPNPIMQRLLSKTWQLRIHLQQFNNAEASAHFIEPLLPEAHFSPSFAGANWEISFQLKQVPDRADALDGTLVCRVVSGASAPVNAGVELIINDWAKSNFLMMPAAAYNGNRYTVRKQTYPPIAMDAEDICLNPKPMITDVPHLNLNDNEDSHLQILTGDETTPCASFFSPSGKYGAILLTDQRSEFGNHGLHVIESADRKQATIRLEAPGVRTRLYQMMQTDAPSWDRGACLKADQQIVLRFRLFAFPADDVQTLYDRFAEVRKDVTGPVALRHLIPLSATWGIQEKKYNEENWNPAGYYAVGTKAQWSKNNRYADWQLGWVGGGMSSLALLSRGGPESRKRAAQTIDWMFTKGQLPSGVLVPVCCNGQVHSDNFRDTIGKRWAMSRKLADGLYFAVKHFMLLEKQDAMCCHPNVAASDKTRTAPYPARLPFRLPEHWTSGATKLADVFVRLIRKHGQLGQFIDMDTGNIVVGGSTSGSMAPGALALAGKYFNRPDYLKAACKLAKRFYESDVSAGVTTAGPGEILQCPDSESAFAMLESFVVLYEITRSKNWLPMAEQMANQCMTWCASYDYHFPPESWLGRLDTRATGSVWANVQNKHSAPGICTLSGDSLLKLWRATGNSLYLDLLQEIAHNLPQYLSREDRQVGDPASMKPGYMCERVNFSDWEERQNIGDSLFGSCWCEISLMLTAAEIPGLYVQPDTGFFKVFDHVDAIAVGNGQNSLDLLLSNPTKFDAVVKVLIESSETAATHPLGANFLFGAPTVTIPAGASITARFTLPGSADVLVRSFDPLG